MTTTTKSTEANERSGARQALLDAAAEVLNSRGAAGFSLREVARRAGYSPGNVYLYFKNKDELIRCALEQAFEEFGRKVDTAYHGTNDPLARIIAIARTYVEFGLDHPAHYRLMFMEHQAQLFIERPTPGVDKLERLYQAVCEARASGEVRRSDPVAMVDAVWAVIHGVVVLAITMPFLDKERAKKMAQEAFKLLLGGLQP